MASITGCLLRYCFCVDEDGNEDGSHRRSGEDHDDDGDHAGAENYRGTGARSTAGPPSALSLGRGARYHEVTSLYSDQSCGREDLQADGDCCAGCPHSPLGGRQSSYVTVGPAKVAAPGGDVNNSSSNNNRAGDNALQTNQTDITEPESEWEDRVASHQVVGNEGSTDEHTDEHTDTHSNQPNARRALQPMRRFWSNLQQSLVEKMEPRAAIAAVAPTASTAAAASRMGDRDASASLEIDSTAQVQEHPRTHFQQDHEDGQTQERPRPFWKRNFFQALGSGNRTRSTNVNVDSSNSSDDADSCSDDDMKVQRTPFLKLAKTFNSSNYVPTIAESEVVVPGSKLQMAMALAAAQALDEQEDDECVICMETFDPTNPRMPTLCGCGQNNTYFHLPCLYQWTEHNEECPSCRQKLRWEEF